MPARSEARKPAVWCPGVSPEIGALARGLRGYWPMWEGHGDRVANLAAPVGDGMCTDKKDGYPRWERCRYGHCLATYPQSLAPGDFLKQRIWMGTASWLSPVNQITVIFRIKPISDTMYPYFGKLSVTGGSSWGLGVSGGAVRFVVTIGGTARSMPVAFSDYGNWQFLVGSYDGRAMRFYRNGVLIAGPTAYTGTIAQYPAVPTSIGPLYGYNGWSFRAQFSEAGLWGRALLPQEIQWLYRNPFAICRYSEAAAQSGIPGAVGGPYHVEAGEVFSTGARAGGLWTAGTAAGGLFTPGASAGKVQ